MILKFKPNEKVMRIIQAVIVNQIKKELDIIMNRFGSTISKNMTDDISLIGISYPIYDDIQKIFSKNYYLTSSEFLADLLKKYISSISNVVDGVTHLNFDENFANDLWDEANQVIKTVNPNDVLNEKLMKAKDNLQLVKIV